MKTNTHNETKTIAIHTDNVDDDEPPRFGFTLAGQYPCQLVKIQEDSPAHKAGLRSGDEILEVNGVNVEDLKHDCVASFISPSPSGKTELRIRRITNRASPQETVKTSGHNVHKSVSEDVSCTTSTAYLSNVVDRVVEEFKRPSGKVSGSVLPRKFKKNNNEGNSLFYLATPEKRSKMVSDEELHANFSPPPVENSKITPNTTANTSTLQSCPATNSNQQKAGGEMPVKEECTMEVVVGYLGSIDQPRAQTESEILLTHLRTRATPPVFVLLEISRSRLNVKNSSKQLIMTCPADALQFVGICPDNQQILGLFTSSSNATNVNNHGDDVTISESGRTRVDSGTRRGGENENENAAPRTSTDHGFQIPAESVHDFDLGCSCHLFVIDAHLIRHLNHKRLTDCFQLLCVPDPSTGSCQQFPTSSAAILNTLSSVFHQDHGRSQQHLLIRSPSEYRLALNNNYNGAPLNTTSNCTGEKASTDLPADCGDGEARKFVPPQHVCRGVSLPSDEHGVTSTLLALSNDSSTQHGELAGHDGNGIEEELVVCLHLYSLVHKSAAQSAPTEIMNYQCKGDYTSVDKVFDKTTSTTTEYSHSSVHQKSQQVNMLTASGITSHHESFRTTEKKYGNTSEEKRNSCEETRRGHKTLAHRRSQSLAGNVTNVVQPSVTVTQAYECHSQSDFRIGNGGRPMFHSSSSILACNNVNNVDGKVARWAVAFDKLLEDKTGLSIFRSFLRKEYSEENLIFWLACEDYKEIKDEVELKKAAKEIYESHLKSCASLPVNVESSAIRDVEEHLGKPTRELYAALQYQIYTLMKFDSYARFLKSELYRQCWVNELEGRPLPVDDDPKKLDEGTSTLKRMVKFVHLGESNSSYFLGYDLKNFQFGSSTKAKGWKTLYKTQSSSSTTTTTTSSSATSETEESKKKSFLPWRGRLKSEPKKSANRSSDSQASSARSSLSSLSDSVFSSTVTNSDEALNDSDGGGSKDQAPPSCRVILPNGCLMYLFCKSTRSLHEGLARLCESKEYALPALDVCIGDQKLTKDDLQKKLTRFINKEIVMKQCVLFRLEFSRDRAVGIKAEADKTITEVLEPILREFSLDINTAVLRRKTDQQQLDKNSVVLPLHQHRVVVEQVPEDDARRQSDASLKELSVHDEIVAYPLKTSEEDKVFDALMGGKRQSITGYSFSESGVFAPLIQQASSKELLNVVKEKDRQRMARSPALFRKKRRGEVAQAPLPTFKAFVVEDQKKESEELFTLLRRSQNSRLDDQRGILDKNLELPDFLKLPDKPPTNKRNTILDVGVPSPRPRHQALKKTTSSPPGYTEQRSSTQASKLVLPTTIAEQRPVPPERNTSTLRNWSGSLRIRGRTHVETVTRVVTETQTIDRRHFSKGSSNSTVVSTVVSSQHHRARAESLQHERSADNREVAGSSTESRSLYASESSDTSLLNQNCGSKTENESRYHSSSVVSENYQNRTTEKELRSRHGSDSSTSVLNQSSGGKPAESRNHSNSLSETCGNRTIEKEPIWLSSPSITSTNKSGNKTTAETDPIWVSSPAAVSVNRRRGSNNNRLGHRVNGGAGTAGNAEVIIPDVTNCSASRFPIPGGVVPFFDRPKPITDSTFFKDFLESSHLEMPSTPDDATTISRDLETTVNERDAILDNSFLREQLKPSRLFSQLTPEDRTPTASPMRGRKQSYTNAGKCPLFIPPSLKITPCDDDEGPASNGNRAGPTNDPRNMADNGGRNGAWAGHDGNTITEESVRVTFV